MENNSIENLTVSETETSNSSNEPLFMQHTATAEKGNNTSIREVIAAKQLGEYKTDNLEDYTQWLKTVNLADLQHHAIKVGVRPSDDRRRTESLLIKEFRTFMARRVSAANSRKKFQNRNLQAEREKKEKLKSMSSWIDAK